MITAEDIASFLAREPTFGEYELIVRVGYRYSHSWRRVVLGVMPLVPVGDNAVISVYAKGDKKPVMQTPAAFGSQMLHFVHPLLLKPDEEIYVEIKTAEPPHRSYCGAAVALSTYA